MTEEKTAYKLIPFDKVKSKVSEIEKIVSEFLARDISLEITNDEQMQNITDFLKESKTMSKSIEKRRKEYVEEAFEYKKAVDKLFNDRKIPLDVFEKKIKTAMEKYHAKKEVEARLKREAEEKRIKEEQDKIEKIRKDAEEKERIAREKIQNAKNEEVREKAKKEAEKLAEKLLQAKIKEEESKLEVSMIADAKSSVRGNSGLASFKKIWTYNIKDEFKIPRKFLKVDESAIKNAIKEGLREIDGVEIYQKKSVSIR